MYGVLELISVPTAGADVLICRAFGTNRVYLHTVQYMHVYMYICMSYCWKDAESVKTTEYSVQYTYVHMYVRNTE